MIKKSFCFSLLTVVLVCLVAIGMGCKHKKSAPIETGVETPEPEKTGGEGQPALDLEKLLFTPGSQYGLETVYFDFDSAALRPDAIAILQKNVEKIKQVPGVIIQLAGHCDERGTQEYNLALGERRALAVRDYLIKLGIPGERLVTISYGEEFPADPGHDEAAWAKNRRVEFNRAQ
ncbi:MAG TPA: peptidoglycan-associated lipoprotein Pal [Candidatus Hydrogenedens sp.]|nr:peptidoglycan-associated lipoprotein Pal [Candidatus Hydrogenedens sp.]